MAKRSKITSAEWLLVFMAVGTLDIIQFSLNMVAIGVFANRLIDIGVGFTLFFYFPKRGVALTPLRIGSLLFAFLAELVPVADVAPLWTLDIFFIFMSVKKEELTQQSDQQPTNVSPEEYKRELEKKQAQFRLAARAEEQATYTQEDMEEAA